MADNPKIKALYEEATALHKQAKDILAEYAGKECPQEKQAEVDKLLDQVEAKTAEAKNLEEQAKREERMAEQDRFLNDPATRRNFFTEKGALGKPAGADGQELDPEELADLKALAPFPAFMAADNPAYAKAMKKYHRYGIAGLTPQQLKDLSVGSPTGGGYLMQDTYFNGLLAKSREASAMRQICTVWPPIPSGSFIAPAEDSMLSDATWTTEVATGAADVVEPFGQRKLKPNPLAKRVKVSNTLMRNPAFDVEAYVRDRMAYKFAIPEENAFINGDGVNKPLGLVNTAGLPTYTTASSNAVYGDDIINWVYSLPAAYAGKARILCNRAFIRKTRTLAKKDSATAFTNYLWQPGLAAGVPNTILDVPYSLSDKLDDGLDASDVYEDNAIIAVVGDFSYFWIVDALQMTIQRLVELYAEANQTGFIGRKESDGMCVMAEAFYALKVKA